METKETDKNATSEQLSRERKGHTSLCEQIEGCLPPIRVSDCHTTPPYDSAAKVDDFTVQRIPSPALESLCSSNEMLNWEVTASLDARSSNNEGSLESPRARAIRPILQHTEGKRELLATTAACGQTFDNGTNLRSSTTNPKPTNVLLQPELNAAGVLLDERGTEPSFDLKANSMEKPLPPFHFTRNQLQRKEVQRKSLDSVEVQDHAQ